MIPRLLFLLASGTLLAAEPSPTPATATAPVNPLATSAGGGLRITAWNDLPIARPSETISVPWSAVREAIPGALVQHLVVRDAAGKPLSYQVTNTNPLSKDPGNLGIAYGELLFQHDFAPGEASATFTVERVEAVPTPFPIRVFARYVPERLDDFAWENDCMAHRVYGAALAAPAPPGVKKEVLVGSGIDLWCKKVDYPIIDRWYNKGHDHYHHDEGEGLDMYSVGTSRGCGGTGIWSGGKLQVSGNYSTWKVLANGPIRAVFELTYGPWKAGGRTVRETKRFTVDAGHQFDRIESTLTAEDGKPEPLVLAVGLCRKSSGKEESTVGFTRSGKEGFLAEWAEGLHGGLGTAVILPRGFQEFAEDDLNTLMLTRAVPGEPVSYLAGAAWSEAGLITNRKAWDAHVKDEALRAVHPLKIRAEVLHPATAGIRGRTPLEWAVLLARSEMRRLGTSLEGGGSESKARWDYAASVFADALVRLGRATGDASFTDYGILAVASHVTPEGTIRGYDPAEHNIDNLQPGKVLLEGLELDPSRKDWLAAARSLRDQMKTHPRTADGGFWHKAKYRDQMWLDGLYMGSPFLARFGAEHGEKDLLDEACRQIILMDAHGYDPASSLHRHGWDEKHSEPWADKATGRSPSPWTRSVGWYAMAIVDTLDVLPGDHPQRARIIAILNRLAEGALRWQDPSSGVWWQVTDQPRREGNYLEASGSSMLVYALAKGVNRGYLPRDVYRPAVQRGFDSLVNEFIVAGPGGNFSLVKVCQVAGLGFQSKSGRPRDGSFGYYVSEPVVENDPKGTGSFIMAGIECQKLFGE
jgi:pectinesterase